MTARRSAHTARGALRKEPQTGAAEATDRGSAAVRRLVDVLLTRRAAQRPALVREMNLPLQTVTDLLEGLASRGLVVVNGRMTGIPGRSSLSYSLAASAAAGLSVHVTASSMETSLCDLRGALIASERRPFAATDGTVLVERIDQAARLICQHADIEHFRLGAAYVVLEERATTMADIAGPLALCLGCPVDLDLRSGMLPAAHLERAHQSLLAALFGPIG